MQSKSSTHPAGRAAAHRDDVLDADHSAVEFKEVLGAEREEIRQLRTRRRLRSAAAPSTPLDHEPYLGVAFSGGGIRSATFNLGVLQGLARNGLLRRIDYLSTVSGGGYIGSWLTAWTARAGIAQVEKGLTSNDPDSELTHPIKWLREYSNYLTPRRGAFGADTWAAVSTYLRNLLLNLIIVIGALTAALLVPRLAFPFFEQSAACWAIWVGLISLMVAVLALAFHLAAVEDPGRSKLESGQVRVQLSVVWPSLVAVWFATAWLWWLVTPDPSASNASMVGGLRWWEWAGGAAVLHAGLWVFAEVFGPRAPTTSTLGANIQRDTRASEVTTNRVADADKGSTKTTLRGEPPSLCFTALRVGFFAFLSGFVGGILLSVVAQRLGEYRPPATFPPGEPPLPQAMVVWGPPAILTIFTLTVILHIGLMGRAISDARREWWSRLGGWVLIYNGAWVAVFALTVYGPGVGEPFMKIRSGLTIGWVTSTVAGLLAGRSAATGGRSESRWLGLVATVGPYVFIVGLATLLSWAIGSTVEVRRVWFGEPVALLLRALTLDWSSDTASNLVTMLLCGSVAALFSWRVDINEFSMHALYRNRLIRCYLGASQSDRKPNEFTGLAVSDDLPLWSLTATRSEPPKGLSDAYDGPYPLINTALNLSAGEELAWQERKASSMVLAPRYCGFVPARRRGQDQPDAAFRSGRTYAAEDGAHPITLGTALAISGAAASPNMGYHSSPPLAFLMTVFNVRLGWWLGNPRAVTESPAKPGTDWHWKQPGPRMGFVHLLNELFGYSTDTSGYIYLSDGGHFDNLGIYELARRECRYIVACDASADGNLLFEDLGGAIRKCRTDLGAEINLDIEQIRKPAAGSYSKWHCAVGTIRYKNGEGGTIVYLKTSLTGDEPSDVRNYASVNPAFPHQSTADQFFDESQFESYRALGAHVVEEVFARAVSEARRDHGLPDLEDLFVRLRQRWYPPSSGDPAAFTRHTKTLDEIANRIREDKHLRFLDGQVFPEWEALTAQAGVRQQPNLWLPEHFEELRSGFYVCTAVIQLMENVFLDLDLDANFDHPQNAGWVNLFKHWSWCGMLRATWAVVGSTYGARFQNFCVHRLDIEAGRQLSIKRATPADAKPHDGKDTQASHTTEDLNFVERGLWEKIKKQIEVSAREWKRIQKTIEKWEKAKSRIDPSGEIKTQLKRWKKIKTDLGANSNRAPTCLVVVASISDPADPLRTLSFNVGFAVTLGKKLIYLRIQDHLRRRGLGRDSLREMVAQKLVDGTAIGLLNSLDLSEDARQKIKEEEQRLGINEDGEEQVLPGITAEMRLEITDDDRSRVQRLFDSVRTSEEN